jgi:hypothetical protein
MKNVVLREKHLVAQMAEIQTNLLLQRNLKNEGRLSLTLVVANLMLIGNEYVG